MSETPLRVGVLAYPNCFASEVFGVADLLYMANHVTGHGDSPPFVTTVVSPRSRVLASGDVPIGVAGLRPVDMLVVPGFALLPHEDLDTRLSALLPECRAIWECMQSGTSVVSVCVGAFVLGEAGLLDGRHATTAWLFADRLAERYPKATLKPHALVVNDTGVTTTAAFSAMFDFVLDLVARQCGRMAARRTARIALLDDARSSQAPYVDDDLLPAVGRSFSDQVRRHIDQYLNTRHNLPHLAERFHVSERTLLRKFKTETGETPLGYLQRARIKRAKHLLETTERSIGEIRDTVGYRDAGHFDALFERHVGLRPREYRATFSQKRAG